MKYKDCEVVYAKDMLKISNSKISRKWVIKNGLCYAASLRDIQTNTEYIVEESEVAAPSPDFLLKDICRRTNFKIFNGRDSIVEEEALRLDMESEYKGYTVTTHFKIYPETPAISQWISLKGHPSGSYKGIKHDESVDNIEDLKSIVENRYKLTGLGDMLRLDRVHKKLGIVDFSAHTDRKDNLCHTREDILTIHSSYTFSSNLFYFHDQISNNGIIFLKEAPLPHARPVKSTFDLLCDGGDLFFTGHGTDDPSIYPGYPFTVILYNGGAFGRIKALHDYQRRFRKYIEKRDDVIWHSTWGDRNADKIVSSEFMLKELKEMKETGGNFLYFSDGWQKGAAMTPLTMERYIGQWEKEGYWEVDCEKFQNGLAEVIDKADEYGMMKGLWFCPDQTDDYINYEKDIEVLLNLYRKYGVNKVKFDAITFRTKIAEKRIKKVMAAFVEESGGEAYVEIDITAGIRTDYFDAMQYGFLFLENRYTDFRRYYPHCTLRNLWQLAHYVDPRRLRIEFLNNERNKDMYPEDPLAPYLYTADYLYVSTIFANPLMWFEISNLSDEYKERLKNIIELCRPIRKEIAKANVYPIGEEPDGFSICGFISIKDNGGYVAVFRGAGEKQNVTMKVPLDSGEYVFEAIAGSGEDFTCGVEEEIKFTIINKYGYTLYRYFKNNLK